MACLVNHCFIIPEKMLTATRPPHLLGPLPVLSNLCTHQTSVAAGQYQFPFGGNLGFPGHGRPVAVAASATDPVAVWEFNAWPLAMPLWRAKPTDAASIGHWYGGKVSTGMPWLIWNLCRDTRNGRIVWLLTHAHPDIARSFFSKCCWHQAV